VCVFDSIQPVKLTEGRQPRSHILKYALLLFLAGIQSPKGNNNLEAVAHGMILQACNIG